MKLSKDRQIQILLAIVIAVLIIVMVSISRNEESDMLEFGDTLTEEITDESGDTTEETAPAAATTTAPTATTTPTPAKTSGGCYPALSAKKIQTPAGIQIAWTKCDSDDFQFYKLVKSATNPNPSYPNDPVIMSSTNAGATSYLDRTVAGSMNYSYRVCVILRLGKVTCGNVASVAY